LAPPVCNNGVNRLSMRPLTDFELSSFSSSASECALARAARAGSRARAASPLSPHDDRRGVGDPGALDQADDVDARRRPECRPEEEQMIAWAHAAHLTAHEPPSGDVEDLEHGGCGSGEGECDRDALSGRVGPESLDTQPAAALRLDRDMEAF